MQNERGAYLWEDYQRLVEAAHEAAAATNTSPIVARPTKIPFLFAFGGDGVAWDGEEVTRVHLTRSLLSGGQLHTVEVPGTTSPRRPGEPPQPPDPSFVAGIDALLMDLGAQDKIATWLLEPTTSATRPKPRTLELVAAYRAAIRQALRPPLSGSSTGATLGLEVSLMPAIGTTGSTEWTIREIGDGAAAVAPRALHLLNHPRGGVGSQGLADYLAQVPQQASEQEAFLARNAPAVIGVLNTRTRRPAGTADLRGAAAAARRRHVPGHEAMAQALGL